MRTIERWETVVYSKILKELFPRIQKDLEKIGELSFDVSTDVVLSCYLHGKVGGGKTIYAAQLYLAEKKKAYITGIDVNCLFYSVPVFFQDLKNVYQNNSSEKEFLNKFYETDLLIFDDLGVEKSSEWAWNILYLVLNYRYENLKKTIITSNLNLKELSEKLGDDRIPSRISRMCKIIEFKDSFTND